MLICLYILPLTLPQYKITTAVDYYNINCFSQVSSNLGVPIGNGSYTGGGTQPDARWYCGVMNYCGFPMGDQLRNTPDCPLYTPGGPVVTSDQLNMVCNINNVSNYGRDCIANQNINSANKYLAKKLDDQQQTDWEAPLSVLFNAFIWMQIFNEICARRINDEYDFFVGLEKSPVFVAVIVITIVLQIIIMQALGLFFSVRALRR